MVQLFKFVISGPCNFYCFSVTSDNLAGKIQIAKSMIEHGAVVQCSQGQKRSVLEVAIKSITEVEDPERRKPMMELVLLLLAHGGNPNDCPGGRDSPIFIALQNGSLDVAETLLHAGADVNHKGRLGRTPLLVWLNAGKDKTFQINIWFIYAPRMEFGGI